MFIVLVQVFFLRTKLQYQGRTISQGQLQPSKQKVRAPILKNVKENPVSFWVWWVTSAVTQLILSLRLLQLLNRECLLFRVFRILNQGEAWPDIIAQLTTKPVLSIYDPDLSIAVYTDVSCIGYGAVLLLVHGKWYKQAVELKKKTKLRVPRHGNS